MQKEKNLVFRAGIIPYIYINNKLKMLFMLPSESKYGGDKFQIAKGKIDEGETPLEAALREGNEELGLFIGNIVSTKSLGKTMLGRTHFFIAKIKDRNLFGDPHFETKLTKWMSKKAFMTEGRDIHKPIIRAAIRLIEENE